MKPYAKLKLPVEIKNKNFIPESVDLVQTPKWQYGFTNPRESLTEEAYEFFSDIFKGEVYVQIHCGGAGDTMPIHVDGRIRDGKMNCPRPWAVNYPWGSNVSGKMYWYKEKIATPELAGNFQVNATSAFKGYCPGWKLDEVEAYESTIVDTTTLINIIIPHNVINYDPINIRWALSIRPDVNQWEWDEAWQLFEPYFVE